MIRRLALAALIAFVAAASATARPTPVDGGLVEGTRMSSGVSAWLGVPFAAPPVRELRWKPPQPIQPWRGIRHAERFAPECLQPLRSPRQNHYFGEEATSEDCLYLNIWAPPNARRAPVIVWIYGGGFNIGSASMANYSGEKLARAGVVRVNIAYRLGALGFLAHPELTRESGYGGSGDYGLMDQIAALQWVKRNIARFGGDPANVTIVGQSAGSMSVALLQMSPLAKGLFARAAGMSGSPFGGLLGPAPLAKAEAQGLALQQELGVTSLEDMRAIPGDKVMAATTSRDPIVLDGYVVTGTAEQVFAGRRQNDVPILVGYTRDESFRPLPHVLTKEELATALRARFGASAELISSAYADADPTRTAIDIGRDSTVGLQMGRWATWQQQFGRQPAYVYLFNRRQPYTQGVTFSDHDPATAGAYHAGDVPYWLRTRDSLNLFRTTRSWEPGDAALEAEMSSALLAFARNGFPVSPQIGAWPRFLPDRPQLVRLAPESRVIAWPHYADLSLFAEKESLAPPDGRRPRD